MRNCLFVSVLLAIFAMPCAASIVPKDEAAALACLKSGLPNDRAQGIIYLVAHNNKANTEVLARHFLTEPDAYLRVQVVEGVKVQVKSSTWAYTCALDAADDVNKGVRYAAAEALASKAGDAPADKKLKALTADSYVMVRIALVNALSVNKSTSAVAIVGMVLSDQNGPLRSRREAAGVLVKMKRPEAAAELRKYLLDADPEIKAAALARNP